MSLPDIAIICGGDSSEYGVSLKSGANVFRHIDTARFTPWMIRMRNFNWEVLDGDEPVARVNLADFSFTIGSGKVKPVYAYIMIHGTPGEDGKLQGYFDMQGLPYSTCGVYTSALTFHKFFCDHFLRSLGFTMARAKYLRKGDPVDPEALVREFGLPLFVKPSAGGSSFGVTKVKELNQLIPATEAAFAESGDCLVEEFIEGMELAVGVCKLNGQTVAFLPTEVVPKGEFFDFDSKYKKGGAEEITPARLPEEKIRECREITARIYDLIDGRGIVRIDYIMKNDIFYFLEINTIPGMTDTSFIPQQLNAMGLDLKEVLTQIIESGLSENGKIVE